jgi:excisionase family DNA binding protein
MALGPWLSTDEAGNVLGVSPGRVRQYILAGRLRAQKHGGKLWVHRGAANAFRRSGPGEKLNEERET